MLKVTLGVCSECGGGELIVILILLFFGSLMFAFWYKGWLCITDVHEYILRHFKKDRGKNRMSHQELAV